MKRSKRTTRKSQVAIKNLIKWLNYAKLLQERKTTTKECKRTTKARGGRNYNVKLQRNCKVTKKLKTIKKRQNKESDTTKNAAKANNKKKWIKTQSGTKQIQRKNSY